MAAHREPANPIKDGSGRHAGHHQPEDVWFLAGTFGGGVARNCIVPAGRPLFFPAFTVWQSRAKPGELPVISNATGHAQLDGVPLPLATIGTRPRSRSGAS
ncbi:hypothetical protein JNW88_02050 [Micromonospora sp. ATA32]|nr:hypothetical protein [Micromonospora sp. ATA32]